MTHAHLSYLKRLTGVMSSNRACACSPVRASQRAGTVCLVTLDSAPFHCYFLLLLFSTLSSPFFLPPSSPLRSALVHFFLQSSHVTSFQNLIYFLLLTSSSTASLFSTSPFLSSSSPSLLSNHLPLFFTLFPSLPLYFTPCLLSSSFSDPVISRCFHLLLSLSADRYDGLRLLHSAPDDSRRVIR